MNLESMFRARQSWKVFKKNHPKVEPFMDAVQRKGYCEGMEIAIAVRYPDGEEYKTGIRVNASDMDMLELARSMKQETGGSGWRGFSG